MLHLALRGLVVVAIVAVVATLLWFAAGRLLARVLRRTTSG